MLEVFASTGVAEDFTVMSVVGARAFKPAPPSYALVERAYPCWRTTLRLHCSMDSISSVPNISVSRSPGSHMPKAFRHREIPMLGRGVYRTIRGGEEQPSHRAELAPPG